MKTVLRLLQLGLIGTLFLVIVSGCSAAKPVTAELVEAIPEGAVARVVYFHAEDCDHCAEIRQEILDPLQRRCGRHLELKEVDVANEKGYEALIATEVEIVGESGRWDIPAVVLGDRAFVGESAIRSDLVTFLGCVWGDGGNPWPQVEALTGIQAEAQAENASSPFKQDAEVAQCIGREVDVCNSPNPIFVLYLSDEECEDTCNRTRYDLRYLTQLFPKMTFEERNLGDHGALADVLDVPEEARNKTPVVVVGNHYLTGEELSLENLKAVIGSYKSTGAPALWYSLDAE